jgi:hypothetical protein
VSATGSSARVTSDRGCARSVDAGYDGRVAQRVNGSGDANTAIGRRPLAGAEQMTPSARPALGQHLVSS